MGKVYTQISFEGVIHFDDVVATLAANGGKGMTSADAATLFTKDAIKAIFSKYKPVRLSEQFPDRTSEWWKGVDGLCGLSIEGALANDFEELPAKYNVDAEGKYTGGMNGWEYLTPEGGTLSPYRIADFNGYYPLAPNLTNGFYVPPQVSRKDTESEAQITLSFGNEGSLSWGDFDSLKNYYFGVLIYNADNNYIRVTSTSTLAQGGGTAKFNPSTMNLGKYTAFPFICSVGHTQTDGAVSGEKIYALPFLKPIEMEVVSTSLNVSFFPILQYNNGDGSGNVDSIAISLNVNNKTNSNMTFTNNYATLRYKGYDSGSFVANEKTISLSTFTAAAGLSTVDLEDLTSVNSSMRNNCVVILSLNNAQYIIEREPAADINIY